MPNSQYPENATVIERLVHYSEMEEHEKALQLAGLCDYLEECFSCELSWKGAS